MSLPIVTIIILAAGSSSRMGKSKQRLVVNEQPLLRKTVLAASESKATNNVVVLGCEEDKNKQIINDLFVEIIVNELWAKGMGTSLKRGMDEVAQKFPSSDAVLIMVCDQPLIIAKHINALIDSYVKTKKPIVASSYAGTLGVPVVFDSKYFESIGALEDDEGAKKIILQNRDETASVDFSAGVIDLDTPEDYQEFLSR